MAVEWQKIAVPRALLNRLRRHEPELFAHGFNWAVSAALCDRLKLTRIRTPLEAQAAGGRGRRGRGKHQQAKAKGENDERRETNPG